MKIDVLESKANRLVMTLEGLDHTFCNALKDELLLDETVDVATYAMEHPLTKKPKFIIETKRGTAPKDALDKAIKGVKSKNNAFAKAFSAMK